MAGERVRGQRLQREQRVLERPYRVAGVEADSHEILAGALHQHLEFARLHVAGVILDGDLDAGVRRPRPHIAQHPDRVLDVPFDVQRPGAVLHAAEEGPYDRRSDVNRRLDHTGQLFLRRSLRGVERFGTGADRPHTQLHLHAQPFRVGPDLSQMRYFQSADEPDLGEVYDFCFVIRRVVQVLERRPPLRADAEQIDSEADLGLRGRRSGGHGCGGEERSTVHSSHYAPGRRCPRRRRDCSSPPGRPALPGWRAEESSARRSRSSVPAADGQSMRLRSGSTSNTGRRRQPEEG